MSVIRARLQSTPVRSKADIQRFFDGFAEHNTEHHGAADRLLNYRLAVLAKHAAFRPSDTVLDIGCGNGHHLLALEGRIGRGIGVDLSAGMVEAARRRAGQPGARASHFEFHQDDAERLAGVPDASVDVVMCVGAIEHMPDKRSVLRAVRRVLRPGGRFVCLTLNDAWFWYRRLAPALGYETRHLASDERLEPRQARGLLAEAGFAPAVVDYWTFIPAGDMPALWHTVFRLLDVPARRLGIATLRGGLVLSGTVRAA
ncbi:MAG: class I SAM-dependent methyltransferase [Rhodothermales bacterium]